jgi:hypothetical protein
MAGAMERRHLRYFIAVAEEGSLTLAQPFTDHRISFFRKPSSKT